MFAEAILVARLFLGISFILWGIGKLRGGEAKRVPLLAALGMPDAKALAIWSECASWWATPRPSSAIRLQRSASFWASGA